MAIDVSLGQPLRHAATYVSSGSFVVPKGVNRVFAVVHGSTGGAGGGTVVSAGGQSGPGLCSGAWVQVLPGNTHQVVVGAGGTIGAHANAPANSNPASGNLGGVTSFDGAVLVNSSNGGGGANARYGGPSGNTGTSGTSSGPTTIPSVSPSNSTIVRTGTISNQNTGGVSASSGSTGNPGVVHIFV